MGKFEVGKGLIWPLLVWMTQSCVSTPNSVNSSSLQRNVANHQHLDLAQTIWKTLLQQKWVGGTMLGTVPHRTQAPHGDIGEMFRANLILEQEPRDVIMLRAYSGRKLKRSSVVANRQRWLTHISVMVKIDGFNPKGKDWFWVKYSPSGQVIREGNVYLAGRIESSNSTKPVGPDCIGCHAAAPGGDLVYNASADYLDP